MRWSGKLVRARRARHGFALLLALVAMLLCSALALTTLFRVQSYSAIARMSTLRRIVASDAEAAVWDCLGTTDAPALRGDPVGTFRQTTSVNDDRTVTVTLTKTDTTSVWIVAEASILRGGQRARHRVGMSAAIPRDTLRSVILPIVGRALVELF